LQNSVIRLLPAIRCLWPLSLAGFGIMFVCSNFRAPPATCKTGVLQVA